MKNHILILSILVVGGLALGCGGGGGGVAPSDGTDGADGADGGDGTEQVPLEQMGAQLGKTACDWIDRCWGSFAALLGEDCEANFQLDFENRQLPEIQSSVALGKVVYHADALAQCIEAMKTAECGASFGSALAEQCDAVFEGKVTAGGECFSNFECIKGSLCFIEGDCPGVCEARLPVGAACESDDECRPELTCMGECQALFGAGGNCTSEGGECPYTFTCVAAAEGDVIGMCKTPVELSIGNVGDECTLTGAVGGDPELPTSVVFCKQGLACVVTEMADTPAIECAEIVQSGAACSFGLPDQCPSGEHCDADIYTGQIEGTCKPEPVHGETCVKGNSCAAGHVCDGSTSTCVKQSINGESCEEDKGCYSQHCVNGTCAPPQLCNLQ